MARELDVQKYLREGHTLADLKQKFDIESNLNQSGDLAVLNYRLLSPMQEQLVRETRGLVLVVGSWDIACKSIDAFFEPTDPMCESTLATFDWGTAKAYDKYDGTLMCMYHRNGAWNVSTRFTADGGTLIVTVNSTELNLTWRSLAEHTLNDMGFSWEEFTSKLDPTIYYVFEICAPEIRVMVVYPDRKLWLVAAVSAVTLEEINLDTLVDFPGSIAPGHSVNSLSEVEAIIGSHPEPYKCEGNVVVDGAFRRLKVRNPVYAQAMRNHEIDSEAFALKNMIGFIAMDASGSSTVNVSGSGTLMSLSSPHIMAVNANTIMHRLLVMSNYVSSSWDAIKSQPDEQRRQNPIYTIWPSAATMFEQGASFSEILGKHTEEESLEALHRFEDFIGRNPPQ